MSLELAQNAETFKQSLEESDPVTKVRDFQNIAVKAIQHFNQIAFELAWEDSRVLQTTAIQKYDEINEKIRKRLAQINAWKNVDHEKNYLWEEMVGWIQSLVQLWTIDKNWLDELLSTWSFDGWDYDLENENDRGALIAKLMKVEEVKVNVDNPVNNKDEWVVNKNVDNNNKRKNGTFDFLASAAVRNYFGSRAWNWK